MNMEEIYYSLVAMLCAFWYAFLGRKKEEPQAPSLPPAIPPTEKPQTIYRQQAEAFPDEPSLPAQTKSWAEYWGRRPGTLGRGSPHVSSFHGKGTYDFDQTRKSEYKFKTSGGSSAEVTVDIKVGKPVIYIKAVQNAHVNISNGKITFKGDK